jgi:hypothetical protein
MLEDGDCLNEPWASDEATEDARTDERERAARQPDRTGDAPASRVSPLPGQAAA